MKRKWIIPVLTVLCIVCVCTGCTQQKGAGNVPDDSVERYGRLMIGEDLELYQKTKHQEPSYIGGWELSAEAVDEAFDCYYESEPDNNDYGENACPIIAEVILSRGKEWVELQLDDGSTIWDATKNPAQRLKGDSLKRWFRSHLATKEGTKKDEID